jgi:6-pyruvoyltetrahydropterin/6-carboxytetrahydropterin synthase
MEATVEAPDLSHAGMVVEFGPFKKQLRRWIDEHLDHGLMLGPDDPLLTVLHPYGMKIHQVPGWPTVENVAALIAQVASDALQDLVRAPGARVTQVRVSETHVNAATWAAP